MSYFYEATTQYWQHVAARFKVLRQNVVTEPNEVIAECEALIRAFHAITPADVGEEFLIENAVDSCDDLIADAHLGMMDMGLIDRPEYALKRYYERRVRELGGEDTMPRYDQLGTVMWTIWRALVEEAYPWSPSRGVTNEP